jgi:hypothetical protein
MNEKMVAFRIKVCSDKMGCLTRMTTINIQYSKYSFRSWLKFQ